ncbi:MAG: ubiquitin-like domain-containing protein [Oscillospiraceae bacterium]|nr:ubiquitin-like domain-containing protein [Oscillospiraceae bacterium]
MFKIIKSKKFKRIVSLTTGISIFFLLTVSVTATKLAHIVDNDKNITLITFCSKPDEILKQAGIKVDSNDKFLIEEENNFYIKININRAKCFTVNLNNESQVFMSTKEVVGEALKENSIVLGENDVISLSLDQKLTDGMQISIKKFYDMELFEGLNSTKFVVPQGTVREALNCAGVNIGEFDECIPDFESIITDNVTVKLNRINYYVNKCEEEINFETISEETDDLFVGEKRIVRDGRKGKKEIVNTTKSVNLEFSENFFTERVIEEPTSEVLLVGTRSNYPENLDIYECRGKLVDSVNNKEIQYKEVMNGFVTAYTSEHGWGGLTSTGQKARPGIIAVDPKRIPYGSSVFIPGYGHAIADDTGSAMLSGKILADVFVDSKEKAMEWGVRFKKIYIL